jgi:arylsulfatase A-like enzyme
MLVVAAAVGAFRPSSTVAASVEHVVLISVDGLRPEFYLDPAAHGMELPAFQALMRRGAYAEAVVGSYPSVTYPSHTTMITGVPPARHGIFNNYLFDERGLFRDWYWHAKSIKVPTLWDAAKAGGGTTAAVSWPVTVGAPVDFSLPEFFKPGSDAPLREVLAEVMRPDFLSALEGAVGPLTDERLEGEARETLSFDVAGWLIQRHRPSLLLIHVYHTDDALHDNGREGAPVARAFEGTDRKLGRLMRTIDSAGLGGDTLVVITGDHGFADVHTEIQLNAALEQEGLLRLGSDGTVGEWRALAWPAGGSCFIVVKTGDAAAAGAAEAVVDRLLAGPLSGAARKVSREELRRLGAMPDAAFALEGTDGYTFGRALRGELLTPNNNRGHHGYLPTWSKMATGFIMAGPGVREGVRVPVMRQIDIAPTIAALAGWTLSSAEGVALRGLFEREEPGH